MQTRSRIIPGLAKALLLMGLGMSIVLLPTAAAQAADRGDSTPKTSLAASGKLAFTDLNGKTYGFQDLAGHKASVFLFVACQCPVCNVYTSRIVALAEAYGTKDVQVFAVYSSAQESVTEIRRHVK